MAKRRYCALCKREVEASKKFNWLAFLFMAGIFYLPVYALKRRRCPICDGKKSLYKRVPEEGFEIIR